MQSEGYRDDTGHFVQLSIEKGLTPAALDRLNIPALVYRCGERITLEEVNESACRMLNVGVLSRGEEPWQWYPDGEVSHPALYWSRPDIRHPRCAVTRWLCHKERGWRMALCLSGCLIGFDRDRLPRVLITFQDMTSRFLRHEEFQRSQQSISWIINATPMGICVLTEDGRFEMVNPAYCRFHGYQEHELIGRPLSMVVPSSSQRYLLRQQQAIALPSDRARYHGECELVARSGERHTVIVESIRIEGGDGRPRNVVFLTDISERKKLEQALEEKNIRLEYLATHDELTGLRNRRFGVSSLEAALEQADRQRADISVALLDIDHFKLINDRYGHAVGDRVLQQFTAVLEARLRASDILVRWGGEEFMLILPGIDLACALQALERLRQVLAAKPLEPSNCKVTFSAGVIEAAGMSVNELIERADEQLYVAKNSGRDRIAW